MFLCILVKSYFSHRMSLQILHLTFLAFSFSKVVRYNLSPQGSIFAGYLQYLHQRPVDCRSIKTSLVNIFDIQLQQLFFIQLGLIWLEVQGGRIGGSEKKTLLSYCYPPGFNPKGCGGGPKVPSGREIVCHFSQGYAMVTKILDFIHIHPKQMVVK